MPFLSVIIPIYKVEPYLRECVDSVLTQTFGDYEIILVDDGSPDNCPAICDEYAAKHDCVRVIHKKNAGLSEARNTGLVEATGEYVAFLDSDDFYYNNKLFENAHNLIMKSHPDIVFHNRKYYDDYTKQYLGESQEFCSEALYETNVDKLLYTLSKNDELDANASLKFIRRTFLTENRFTFLKGILSEDVEWFFHLLPQIESAALLPKDEGGYAYRRRDGSITKNVSQKHVNNIIDIVCKNAEAYRDITKCDLRTAAILNYLAYEYYITLGLIYAYADKAQKKPLLKRMKAYQWLGKYSISRKTKKASWACKIPFFGIAILGKHTRSRSKT